MAHIRADALAPEIDRMKVHIQNLFAHVLGEFIENIAVTAEGHGRGQQEAGAENGIDATQRTRVPMELQDAQQVEQRW